MAIKFKEDPDLMFLKFCDNCDLSILADTMKGPDKDKRWSEKISTDDRFINCNGNYQDVWEVIAGELQLFGGDTIVNFIRGNGVSYRELLIEACKQVKVNFNEKSEVSMIETNLLMKVLENSLEKMSVEEREELAKQFGLNIKNFAPSAVMMALQAAIKAGGFQSYRLALIVANAVAKMIVGRGLPFAVNAALMKTLSVFSGPIGWAISGILTVPQISGPAFRVTIPACIQVAYMRQKSLNKDHF